MDAVIDIAARLSGATTEVATRVTGAIRNAASTTGAGFDYLLNTALRESNLNPDAKSKSSSATGLFQFIDQTWLGTLKQSGAGLGYGKYADAITRTPQGRFAVADPAMRREIMALRKDANANAVMAGAFANSNAKVLTDRLGRKPTDGELYMAHFLGASGAARFISAAQARPDAKAANLFPKAAAANSSIFYDKQGGARSLKQVYAGLAAKHNVVGRTQLAAVKTVEPVKPNTVVAAAVPAPAISFFRDIAPTRVASAETISGLAAIANATAIAPAAAVVPLRGAAGPALAANATGSAPQGATLGYAAEPPQAQGPIFRTLFHTGERGAVAPVVSELWGAGRGAEAHAAIAPVAEMSTAPKSAAPTFAAPSLFVPTIAAPSVTAPSVTAPSVTAPSVTAPSVTAPGVTAPSLTAPAIGTPKPAAPKVAAPSQNAPFDLFQFLRSAIRGAA